MGAQAATSAPQSLHTAVSSQRQNHFGLPSRVEIAPVRRDVDVINLAQRAGAVASMPSPSRDATAVSRQLRQRTCDRVARKGQNTVPCTHVHVAVIR